MLKIAFRNVFRNRRRTIITFILITFGSLLFSIFRYVSFGVHQDLIWHVVEMNTGFVQIAGNGWLENPGLERAMDIDENFLESLKKVEGVDAVAPRISGYGLISHNENSRYVSVLAVDIPEEIKITSIQKRIREGKYLDSGAKENQGVIGFKLAAHLGIKPGDTAVLVASQFDGSMGAISVKITGIYKAVDAELDMSRIIVNFPAGRELFAPDDPENNIIRYTSIAIGTENYRTAEKLFDALSEKYPLPVMKEGEDRENSDNYEPVALNWDDLNPGVVQMVLLDEIQNDLFYSFLVIIIAFGVLNNVQMSIHERTRELGILLAVGTKPLNLHKMIIFETLIVLLPSLITGNILGIGICYYWQHHPIVLSGDLGQMYAEMGFEPVLRPILDFFELWVSILSIFIPCIILALIASRRIFKLSPVRIIGTI